MRNCFSAFSPRLFAVVGLLTSFAAYSQDSLPRDYSNTNSVTIVMAAPERRDGSQGHGLEHAAGHADGWTTVTNVAGVACRSLDLSEQGERIGYMYFTIDRSFKEQDVSHARIEVEYYDGLESYPGVLGLQYDASGSGGINPAYKPLLPVVPLKGSKKWLKTTFYVRDAAFQNSQNGGADFRLWASPPHLCVSRVTVTLDPLLRALKPQPLAFNAAGEGKLGDWNVQWDSGRKPSFSISTNRTGPRWLEIRAPGSTDGQQVAGSWRTSVLLEPGEYQFAGKARTEGVDPDPTDGRQGGVTLRLSYRRGSKMVSAAPDWTPLTYDFILGAPEQVELVCEFRGSQGTARFDVDSLKLIRKGKGG